MEGRMTEPLFRTDAYLRSTTARVVAVEERGIVLDRTVFYPRAGGQPGDTGTIRWEGGEAALGEAVKGEGDAILHPLQGNAPPVGAEVEVALDWERRYRHMRMHTSMHLLCSLIRGADVTGGQIGADKSRLDFDLPDPPAKEWLAEQLNALVSADHAVSESWITEAELDANPGLVRTLSVQPPRGSGRVRLVRIGSEPVDLQPCGGTHVRSTAEIGALEVLKIENKGKQNRRVSLALREG
jgi:misacylated tRNA(Ala) deacylase